MIVEKAYEKYYNLTKSKKKLLQVLTFNLSTILLNEFDKEFYIFYVFDIYNQYNFASANFKAFKKRAFKINITRDFKKLHSFKEEDFIFKTYKLLNDNYRYISKINNKNIEKILNEQIYLKNIVRFLVKYIDDKKIDDILKLYRVYKLEQEIPEDKRESVIQVIGKPKVIVRAFKNNKNNSLLFIFERHSYNPNKINFIKESKTLEFDKNISTVYLEIFKN